LYESKLYTEPGKRIAMITEKLIGLYDDMKELQAADNYEAMNKCHSNVTRFIAKLEDETIKVLTTPLGVLEVSVENRSKISRRDMLMDIYFNIIPTFVKTMITGILLYGAEGSLATPALEEVTRIVILIGDLAERAVKEPKDVQPKSPAYQLAQPTRRLNPMIRDFYSKCRIELKSRERAETVAEAPKPALDWEKKRKDEDTHRQEAEAQRRKDERSRKQWQTLSDFRAVRRLPPPSQLSSNQSQSDQLSHTHQTRLAQDRAAAEEEARRLAESLRAAESRAQRLRGAEELERQGLAGGEMQEDLPDTDYERVHIFGRHNARESTRPWPWSRDEMYTLIDGLRSERGPDRYQQLVTRLDRSLDEIFDKAKEFKVTAIDDHEQKQRRLPQWIASIGIEQQ
jgi:hypothetical protein